MSKDADKRSDSEPMIYMSKMACYEVLGDMSAFTKQSTITILESTPHSQMIFGGCAGIV